MAMVTATAMAMATATATSKRSTPRDPTQPRGGQPGGAVPIGQDGQAVLQGGRNTFVLGERDTLIRGWYETDPGFEARDIRGIVTIYPPNGEPQEASHTLHIDAPRCPTLTTACSAGSCPPS